MQHFITKLWKFIKFRVPISFTSHKVKTQLKNGTCVEFFKSTLKLSITYETILKLSVFRKAIPAINRPPFGRLEWNLSLNPAVRTDNLVHFSGAAVAASETTAAAISVATTVGISSVIKTHFRSPPLVVIRMFDKNMIRYNLLFKNKNGVFNNRL